MSSHDSFAASGNSPTRSDGPDFLCENHDILREKGMLKGPKRREAVRINTLTAFGGVSSKWCYWFRCTGAKKVPRKIAAGSILKTIWPDQFRHEQNMLGMRVS